MRQQLTKEVIKGCIYNLFTIFNQIPDEEEKIISITRRLQPGYLNDREWRMLHCQHLGLKELPELIENAYKWVRKKLNESNLSMRQLNIEERVEIDKNVFVKKIQEILSWCEKVNSLTRYSEGETISQDVQYLSKNLKTIETKIKKAIVSGKISLSEELNRYQRNES